jgi:hypothetical protein
MLSQEACVGHNNQLTNADFNRACRCDEFHSLINAAICKSGRVISVDLLTIVFEFLGPWNPSENPHIGVLDRNKAMWNIA